MKTTLGIFFLWTTLLFITACGGGGDGGGGQAPVVAGVTPQQVQPIQGMINDAGPYCQQSIMSVAAAGIARIQSGGTAAAGLPGAQMPVLTASGTTQTGASSAFAIPGGAQQINPSTFSGFPLPAQSNECMQKLGVLFNYMNSMMVPASNCSQGATTLLTNSQGTQMCPYTYTNQTLRYLAGNASSLLGPSTMALLQQSGMSGVDINQLSQAGLGAAGGYISQLQALNPTGAQSLIALLNGGTTTGTVTGGPVTTGALTNPVLSGTSTGGSVTPTATGTSLTLRSLTSDTGRSVEPSINDQLVDLSKYNR